LFGKFLAFADRFLCRMGQDSHYGWLAKFTFLNICKKDIS